MAILNHIDLYHVGIVVDDLDAAKDEYAKAVGVTWGVEGTFPDVALDDERGRRLVTMSFAYSNEGPVRMELLQSVEGTILTPVGRGQLHHLGYWSQDVERDAQQLIARGMTRLASLASVVEEGLTAVAYLGAASGGIIELVDERTTKQLLFPNE